MAMIASFYLLNMKECGDSETFLFSSKMEQM